MNEIEMLRAARPEVHDPASEVLDAALVRVLNDAEPSARRRLARRSPRGRILLAGGLGAVAAAGVGLVPVLSGKGAAPANAAVELRLAAAAVRAAPEPTVKPSQWVYIETKVRGVPGQGVMWAPGEDADTPRPTTSFDIRSWYPAIGGAILKCPPIPKEPKVCGPAVASTLVQQVNGREIRLALFPNSSGWDPDDQAFVRKLPTDAGALLKRVYSYADRKAGWQGFDRDQEAVEAIADLMDGHVSQALRAALYDALSRVPGVRMDRNAVDNAGRRGLGFSRTGHGETVQIIVARGTYRYLGDKVTAVKDHPGGVKAGTVLRWSAQLRVAVVDKARQLPS
ncbi:CU044_5270 family protein [Spirillospora sp. NPDC048911]|uniref:CU044_5270 family protein n=1 Tax=Spirillospora sp. NPDC048911 TaxID=3364527 RepID=UPI0037211D01